VAAEADPVAAPHLYGPPGIDERRVQLGMLSALALIEPHADRPQPITRPERFFGLGQTIAAGGTGSSRESNNP
jgi:hypothetical protein